MNVCPTSPWTTSSPAFRDDDDEQEKVERKRVTKRDRKAKRSYSRYRHGGRRGTRDG
jgi:hypothetical protein